MSAQHNRMLATFILVCGVFLGMSLIVMLDAAAGNYLTAIGELFLGAWLLERLTRPWLSGRSRH